MVRPMDSQPKVATRSSRLEPRSARVRQQLAEQLREIGRAPRDAEQLRWLDAETQQLRKVFHAAGVAYLQAIKLPLDAVDERHAAWVDLTAAALAYALAADFAAAARSLGDAVG